ncbi:hypothetical protein [Acaryochloris sp. IP29b_bin.137]|uniref:hypothetical protein n=1 Tax=Acaryochloris sp. IP29b_bin.137 TaxID=2969217 RepID=UPI0026310919|nr:hypothetical protein [Acaryochloris sp. IP29b_bin.137]
MVSNFLDKGTQGSKSDWNPHKRDEAIQATWANSTPSLYAISLNRDHAKVTCSTDAQTSLFQAVETSATLPSLGELIALSCHRLISYIQLSRFLPIYVKQAWIRQIRVLDLQRWQASLTILEELYFDHRCAQEDYRPGHDIFDAQTNLHQDFNTEMSCIEHELNTIQMILKYAEVSTDVI